MVDTFIIGPRRAARRAHGGDACYADPSCNIPRQAQETAMQNLQEMYQSKRGSALNALDHLKDGDMIIVPTGVGEPPTLLHALSDQHRRFNDIKVAQILAMRKYGYFEQACRPHVRHAALFFGGASRAGGQGGWCEFIPNYFSEIPALIERGLMPADVVFAMASTMSASGHFALSLGADYTMAAVAKARAVVLEVNPNVPFTHGQCHVHLSQVTAIVESEDPILEVGLPKIGPVQEAIGALVAEHIEDGSTLQIGYGGIPDAVVMQLTNKRDLGIHTEMIGDGILTLVEAGAVNNSKKTLLPGKMVATFALGSRKLYEFMHQNPMLEMHPSNFTNDPYIAGQNDRLVTINASLQVDLLGQCGSESIGHLPYSGTGGQVDFVRAANRSRGGKSFIVLPSTAKDGTLSRIVPTLSPGTHATTSKNDVNYVVTEWGVAQLRGKSAKQRAQALIAIAHPDFRPWLREEADRMCVF
jgi:acyl-CoA hydrolase